VIERNKSGDCSKTNAYIYNTFEFYLRNGFQIDMYGLRIPEIEIPPVNILDKMVNITAQTFHAYETIFLKDFQNHHDMFPPLSDNCDPNYNI